MTDSYKALCTDFYVNQKVALKMDLPRTRESVLEFFERIRRQFPAMGSFRRYRDELALESPQTDMPHRWVAVRANNIRSGVVNPNQLTEAYSLHKTILDSAPAYMSITPLDVDHIELLYGFDLAAGGNHDAIVLDALLHGSPLQQLLDIPNCVPIDYQPVIGFSLGSAGETEVHFEVKTRPSPSAAREMPEGHDPISVYLTLRRFGPIGDVKDLEKIQKQLTSYAEDLIESRLIPSLIMPIRHAIASGNA